MANDGISGSERIIRIEMCSSAPTGEGERYITDKGRVWQPVRNQPPQTGDRRGDRIGDVIYPK